METKPDLQAFQRPTVQRNPKGFGYVTFLHLQALRQRGFVKRTCCWCAARSHLDSMLASGGRESNPGAQNLHFEFLHRSCILKFS